ncbi:cytochrome d ubiquinol oxidase subunit II [Dermacoccaceae bacterium W4C1]
MELSTVWFILIAVLWTGYLVLEGFDFGVGMSLPLLSRNADPQEANDRRRLMLTTIGPHWDGNEVWLLTAGGAMFAAFPAWYAAAFSGMYLPLLALLVALIVRIVGLEYRHKRSEEHWVRRWDLVITAASVLAPFLVGTALTLMVHGLPINADHVYTGSLLELLHPIGLLGGLTAVVLSLTHGAHFLALKTRGPLRGDARRLGARLAPVAAALVALSTVVLGLERGNVGGWVLGLAGAAALLASLLAHARTAEGWAFVATAAGIAAWTLSLFVMLFPNVLPSTLNSAWDLSAAEAASSALTLKIMTWATVIALPITLIYTAYTYWVFRKRISTDELAAH